MPDFIIHALLIGVGVAMVSGPLGAFAVWRRMAYFGDTLAHSALIGVALGIFLDINIQFAIVLCCSLLALLLVSLQKSQDLATDTLLGILAHSSLALGLVLVSFYSDTRIDLFAYLFGDLLTASRRDVWIIFSVGLLVLSLVIIFWRPLLTITVDEDLAKVEGLPVTTYKILLMLMMAFVIAMAMKVVGVLLITALLIIPAAASRRIASTAEMMALMASILGSISVTLGLGASYWWDTPAGPSIVLACSLIFIVISMITYARRHNRLQRKF